MLRNALFFYKNQLRKMLDILIYNFDFCVILLL